jgi:DinB family protein
MSDPIEPWLRGPLAGVNPLLCPLIYSFQQASEDLRKWTEGLSTEQVWARPHGLAPLGFQIRHIGGSVERLMTYVMGGQLNERQMNDLATQMDPGATLDELLAQMEQRFADAEAKVRAIDPAILHQPRQVGRKRLPTTVGGLLTHIAEHMQRHVGQAVVTAKIVRS